MRQSKICEEASRTLKGLEHCIEVVAHIDAFGYSSVLLNNITKENLLNIILRTHAFTMNLPPKS